MHLKRLPPTSCAARAAFTAPPFSGWCARRATAYRSGLLARDAAACRWRSSQTPPPLATYTRKKCSCSRTQAWLSLSTACICSKLDRYRSFVPPLDLLRLLEQRLLCVGLSTGDAFIVQVTQCAIVLLRARDVACCTRGV
jgi:hypothetical protein